MEGKVRESVCGKAGDDGGGVGWGGPMAGERNAHTSEKQRLSPEEK